MFDHSSRLGTSPSITGSTWPVLFDADGDALGVLEMMPVIILVTDVALSAEEPEETHTTNFVPAPCFLATCHGGGVTHDKGNERSRCCGSRLEWVDSTY